jgi:hypothetical protein
MTGMKRLKPVKAMRKRCLVERLQSLRNELELRFTGQFVENAVCTLDSAKSALTAAHAEIAALRAERDAARVALINLTAESYAGEGTEAFLAAWELVGTFNDQKGLPDAV